MAYWVQPWRRLKGDKFDEFLRKGLYCLWVVLFFFLKIFNTNPKCTGAGHSKFHEKRLALFTDNSVENGVVLFGGHPVQ